MKRLGVTTCQSGSYVVRGRRGKPYLAGNLPGFISHFANFANCASGITYHRIGKMRTLRSLWKNLVGGNKMAHSDAFLERRNGPVCVLMRWSIEVEAAGIE